MRTRMTKYEMGKWRVTALGALAALSTCGGCFDLGSDCEFLKACNGVGGTGGTGGTGGGTTISPSCMPSNSDAPVDDACGVFVSSSKGSDANAGTKAEPFATLGKAIAAAGGYPIYACTDGVSGAVKLDADATIYGGLDCTQGWTYVGLTTKTPWTAGADEIPLRLAAGARATLEDIAITAADAAEPGGSSIAVLSEVATQLALSRCEVNAGMGADGAAGETPVGAVTNGLDGLAGKDACVSDSDQTGGSAVVLSCGGTAVNSGSGGNGTTSDGGAGSPGKPAGPTGAGGTGEDDMNACTAGGEGAAGMLGEAGLGAPSVLGGGGGGGGGKVCSGGKAGASGGSGGSGACGGAGGKGGEPGGSSIGIVSLGAKLTLDTVSLTTKKGGNGGNGGDGQLGGQGGGPGIAGLSKEGSAACAGGKGGDGGPGGKGGGGLGGHSIGIAHTGEAPDVSGATITTGPAGGGGAGEVDMGNGAAGVAAQVQAF